MGSVFQVQSDPEEPCQCWENVGKNKHKYAHDLWNS